MIVAADVSWLHGNTASHDLMWGDSDYTEYHLNLGLHWGKSCYDEKSPFEGSNHTSLKVTRLRFTLDCCHKYDTHKWFGKKQKQRAQHACMCLCACCARCSLYIDMRAPGCIEAFSFALPFPTLAFHTSDVERRSTPASILQTSDDAAKPTPPPLSQRHPVCLPAQPPPPRHIHHQGNTGTSQTINSTLVWRIKKP